MKAQKVFEMVKRHHPTMPGREIVDIINDGVDEMCRRTNIYHQSYSQDTVAGQRYYTLDAKIFKILNVTLNEVEIPRLQGSVIIDDDELVETGGSNTTYDLAAPNTSSTERFWYESLGRIAIVEKVADAIKRSDKVSQYQSVSIVGILRLHTIASPSDLTTSNIDSSDILSGARGNFGRYVADYGIAQGYRNPEALNPDQAEYFEARYEKGIKEARKLGKSGYSSNGRIVPVDF